MNNIKNEIDNFIANYIKDNYSKYLIQDSMFYSLEGGKRFRSLLIYSICKGFNKHDKSFNLMLAIEMIQAYSLIHDDLPAMDNDVLRRGKPTSHIKYGEANAILTGDCLLTEAFNVLSKIDIDPSLKIEIIQTISSLIGHEGMIKGQYLDMLNDTNRTNDDLCLIEDLKTGSFFKAAILSSMLVCDDKEHIEFYNQLSNYIGRLFQMQDDLFEITKSQEEFGKKASDIKNNKFTALSLYTKDELINKINELFNICYKLIDSQTHFDTTYLKNIINEMEKR